MSKSPLNDEIDRLTRELTTRGNRAVALHSAACAERIYDFYTAYAAREGKGEPQSVRAALDSVWDFLGQGSASGQLAAWLPLLQEAVPFADDCNSVECLLAPYPCMCVDAAVRYCLDDTSVRPGLEYALEGLRALQCHHQTGYIDLGTGPEADALEATLLESPIIRSELEREEQDLRDIQRADQITAELVDAIRNRAVTNRLTLSHYVN